MALDERGLLWDTIPLPMLPKSTARPKTRQSHSCSTPKTLNTPTSQRWNVQSLLPCQNLHLPRKAIWEVARPREEATPTSRMSCWLAMRFACGTRNSKDVASGGAASSRENKTCTANLCQVDPFLQR